MVGSVPAASSTCQERVKLCETSASVLVRLDPRRGRARIAEQPMRHGPVTGGRVVLQRQRFALVGQLREGALLHGLADLPLDEALPCGADLPGAVRSSMLGAHT